MDWKPSMTLAKQGSANLDISIVCHIITFPTIKDPRIDGHKYLCVSLTFDTKLERYQSAN